MPHSKPLYKGRFAPSPSGPLHLGSLTTALASFLDAKHHHGIWTLRIEDIDPPRQPKDSIQQILFALEAYGLEWDQSISYQSQHHQAYNDAVEQLVQRHQAYSCRCTRKQLRALKGQYNGLCRHKPLNTSLLDLPEGYALRLKTQQRKICYHELCSGTQETQVQACIDDGILIRKDKLYAYLLAVVVDDHLEEITHIVRGNDLQSFTPLQTYLQQLLFGSDRDTQEKIQSPYQYLHLPLITDNHGRKLSKQTFAPAIPVKTEQDRRLTLYNALTLLGQQPEPSSQSASCPDQLALAIPRWSRDKIPKQSTLIGLTR